MGEVLQEERKILEVACEKVITLRGGEAALEERRKKHNQGREKEEKGVGRESPGSWS